MPYTQRDAHNAPSSQGAPLLKGMTLEALEKTEREIAELESKIASLKLQPKTRQMLIDLEHATRLLRNRKMDAKVMRQALAPQLDRLQPGQNPFEEIRRALSTENYRKLATLLQGIEDPEARDLALRCSEESTFRSIHKFRPGLDWMLPVEIETYIKALEASDASF